MHLKNVVWKMASILSRPECVKYLLVRHPDFISVQWRHNERHGVSNHQPHDCLLNRLFQIRENKAPRHWPLCAGNSPLTGEFPAQRASIAEIVSIWWRHHVTPEFSVADLDTNRLRAMSSLRLLQVTDNPLTESTKSALQELNNIDVML